MWYSSWLLFPGPHTRTAPFENAMHRSHFFPSPRNNGQCLSISLPATCGSGMGLFGAISDDLVLDAFTTS